MYGNWGNWSECSAELSQKTSGYLKCDGKGLRERRKYLLRAPSPQGKMCKESPEEKENCTLPGLACLSMSE